MKNAELRFESIIPDQTRDAVGVRLRVYIDGEPSSAVNAVVSGTDLLSSGLTPVQVQNNAPALMHCAAAHVQIALDDGRLPLPDRLGVLEVRVGGEDLRRYLDGRDLPSSVALSRTFVSPMRVLSASRSLESVSIANFGGFCEPQRLQIGRLTFLVGANGSGKSGMLTVLEMSAALAEGRRDMTSIVGSDWQHVDCAQPTLLALEMSRATPGSVPEVRVNSYEAILQDYESDVAIAEERLREGAASLLFERPSQGWGIVYRAHAMSDGIEMSAELASSFNWRTTALSWFRDDGVFPESQPVAQCVRDIAVYRGWQFGKAKDVRSQVRRNEISGRLHADGSNFPEVLARLLSNGQISNELHEALREVLPGKVTITAEDMNRMDPSIRVVLDGAVLGLHHLSDGTLQWLQLLAILKSPDRASIIALDEPELGLHPDCISALGHLLCDVVEDSATKLVIATHSARLLDVFEARGHSSGLRVFEREAAGIRITTPSERQLDIWCDEQTTLGEAWLRGAFGGGRW
jgi:predicted ATPase